jgi:serine/threonine-protein kinase
MGKDQRMTRRVADRYLLAEQIGTGGTSRVYAAVDERLGRRVAVKLLDADLAASVDPAGRERFLREGPAAASFHHRHAVTVFDAGEHDGELYIVMEFIDGPSLAELISRDGPLQIDDATRIAGQVLEALAAAHAAGMVHRDVKPGNILLRADGDAALTDFGIAKRFDDLDDSVTRTGTVIGTPRYLAPEQATGAPTGPFTDVYSMGLVLFEMLTARLPFLGNTPTDVALVQLTQQPADVRTMRPEVPAALAAAIGTSLSLDPAARFATAGEMADALTHAWAPPPPPLPESAVPTRLMGVVVPMAGEHSGHTAVMPIDAPCGAVADLPIGDVEADARTKRMTIFAFIACALALILAAWLLSRGEDGQAASPVVTSVAPTSTAPARTAAPTTVAPTSPPTSAAPVVNEIIPGFPATDSLQTFEQQIRANPLIVGAAGQEVAAGIRSVLDERGKKQRDRAKALVEQLPTWVSNSELNPAIADALNQLLAPLADKAK